jgi:hypothetical protein
MSLLTKRQTNVSLENPKLTSRPSLSLPEKSRTTGASLRKSQSFNLRPVARTLSFTQKKPLGKGRLKVPMYQGLSVKERIHRWEGNSRVDTSEKIAAAVGVSDAGIQTRPEAKPNRPEESATQAHATQRRGALPLESHPPGQPPSKLNRSWSVANLQRKADEAPVSVVLSLLLLVMAGLLVASLVQNCLARAAIAPLGMAHLAKGNSGGDGGSRIPMLTPSREGLPKGPGRAHLAFQNSGREEPEAKGWRRWRKKKPLGS